MSTVLFLGAGATKSARGLMTDEILPAVVDGRARLASEDPKGIVDKLLQFLSYEFHVYAGLPKERFPSLPLLMSLIDMALDRREVFTGDWTVSVLSELREAIEFGIFDVLEDALNKFPTNHHYMLLDALFVSPLKPQIITTNYDLVVDSALMYLSESRQPLGGIPNYHCGIANIS